MAWTCSSEAPKRSLHDSYGWDHSKKAKVKNPMCHKDTTLLDLFIVALHIMSQLVLVYSDRFIDRFPTTFYPSLCIP